MKRITKIGLTLGTLLVSAALAVPAKAWNRQGHGYGHVTQNHHRQGHHDRQRHHHSVYRFPLRVDHRWEYRDHARIDYHGRHVSVHLGF